MESELPIKDQILMRLKEPVLFVRRNGDIIQGNDAAYALLNIDEEKDKSVNNYLDVSLLLENEESHLIMEIKNRGQLAEVTSIDLGSDMVCLIMHDMSISDKAEKVKRYISEQVYADAKGIVMYKGDGIIDCDQTFAAMFGYSEREMKNMTLTRLVHHKSLHKLHDVHRYPHEPNELSGIRADGSIFHFDMMGHPYNGSGDTVKVSIIKDITDRIENEKQIEYMAYYDKLTDLPNWNYIHKVLKDAVGAIGQAENSQDMLAVYFIDLNYFKGINDTFGYNFGDQLLKACGERLKTFLNTDTFIARMGGDEFLILQRSPNSQKAIASFAEALIAAFEKPVNIHDYEMFISISIGISIYPEHGFSASELIKHADSAMYVIQDKLGSNYNVFETAISENFKAKLTMESELRTALKEEQFELHYQPQKCLTTNEIVGIEALLRWKHPEKGYIPPDQFIGLAEKTGLIMEIGDWVLREACRTNKLWQEEGYKPAVVGVNMSARQFYQKGFVDNVKTVLDNTGLAPEYLELEITETIAMTNEDKILETLHRLRELGVRVSIDDFGTGHSSFKYLSVFPITKLKIDKMFINENRKQNQAIVKSIIHMSHSLNMRVIAEGVETTDQLKFLTEQRCDEMQGFHFSKPLPPEKLAALFPTVS